ncbi:MAG: hypothetical protein QOD44_2581, partial [Solirubrobacteraceae bacterium]|nr:hypothetical protein [Solirubrobacteraceae bacterium]
ADLCRRYEAAGVDQVIFVLQAGRNRHEHICESLELFGSEVLPEFAPHADARDAARDAELSHAIAAALARREPPRVAPAGYGIEPLASGPPAHGGGLGDNGRRAIPRPRIATFQRLAQERGEQAFQAFVRRADDRRLEQIAGSQPGLRVVFGAMEQAYVPEKANGFDGELQYDLRRASGETVHWTLRLDPERASARPGPANDPALTVKLTLADFLRMAGRDLDPGKALLTGRLDLEGDFALAQRLGEMFGQPAAL